VGREQRNEQVLPGTLEMLVLTVLSMQVEHWGTPGGCSALELTRGATHRIAAIRQDEATSFRPIGQAPLASAGTVCMTPIVTHEDVAAWCRSQPGFRLRSK
jgi:hypothetical protein